jgi:predicted phosphodiesterase
MKIALITDIHANYRAFLAAAEHAERWGAELVIVGGDMVNRGPCPRECLDFAQRKAASDGWVLLRGNHEEYVISHAAPPGTHSEAWLKVHRASAWTYEQIEPELPALKALPLEYQLTDPQGGLARFVHASLLGLREGIFDHTPEPELRRKIGLDQAPGRQPLTLFGVGHTHIPVVRRLDGVLVVNAGSAGLPFDYDIRPTYAQITWNGAWQAEIIRLDYDLEAARQDFYTNGFLEGAGPLARLVEVELLQARSMLYEWAVAYQQAVLQGEISMQQSVEQYLSQISL